MLSSRRQAAWAASLVLGLALAGCGDDAENADVAGSEVPPAVSTPATARTNAPVATETVTSTVTATAQDFCDNVRTAIAARPAPGGTVAEMEQRARVFAQEVGDVVRTAPESTRPFWQALEQVARDTANMGEVTLPPAEARQQLLREGAGAVAEVSRTCDIEAADIAALIR